MTMSNHDRARERLEQYQRAVRDSRFCQQRIDTLREEATSCTHAIGASSAGRTGEYVIETVEGKKEPGKPKPIPSDVSIPVKHIPRVQPGTRDPKAGEKYLAIIIDQILEYERRIEKNTQICREIEAEIDGCCDGDSNLVLKYRYLEGLSLREVADRIKYSRGHVKRFMADALDAFSQKMSHYEPK